MKATKRNIAICGLTVVVCASLLAGVTYAWFTDSITNSGNTISSGDLKIDATAYDLGEDGKSYEINGKTYTFEAEGQNLKTDNKAVIAETNWYPGQSSAKLFTVENVGSLDAAVSLDFFVSGGLTNALWFDFIQVGETGVVSGQFKERPMETLPDLADQLGDVKLASKASMSFVLVYGMEEEAQNEYMNKSFQVNVFISAKQTVEGAEGPVVVNPGTDLSEAIKEVSDNSTIVLAANSEYEVKNPIDLSGKKGIVIDGNGATITMSESVEGASFLSFAAMRANAETRTNYQKSIIRVEGASDVIIRNLTIEGSESHGINVYDCSNVTIEDVNINNSAELAICVNGSDVSLVNVHTSGSGWGAVNLDLGTKGTSSLTVDADCQFEEYLQIYADSTTVADKVSVNAAGYNRYNVVATDGNNRVLWTNNENVVEGAVFVDDAEGLASAVLAGGNVILASDIEVTSNLRSSSNIVINLNSYTISSSSTITFFGDNMTVTITNGTFKSTGFSGRLRFENDENVTIQNVNFIGNGTGSQTIQVYDETSEGVNLYNISNCIFQNAYVGFEGSSNDYPYVFDITFTDCNFVAEKLGNGASCVAIDDYIKGTAVFNGCNFNVTASGNASAAIYCNGYEGYIGEAAMGVTLNNVTVVGTSTTDYFGSKTPAPVRFNQEITTVITETGINSYTIDGFTTNYKGDMLVTTGAELKAALEKGGVVIVSVPEIVLKECVTIENYTKSQLIIPEGCVLHLTGIKFEDDPNGENLPAYAYDVIDLNDSAQLTISGEGTMEQDLNSNIGYLIRANDNSTVIINSGNFVAGLTCVQAGNNAKVKVYGGNFNVLVDWQNVYWHFNLIDNSKATITIYGGTFVNYDPSNSKTENPVANFVADDYTVELFKEGEDIIYTVVPDTEDAE